MVSITHAYGGIVVGYVKSDVGYAFESRIIIKWLIYVIDCMKESYGIGINDFVNDGKISGRHCEGKHRETTWVLNIGI